MWYVSTLTRSTTHVGLVYYQDCRFRTIMTGSYPDRMAYCRSLIRLGHTRARDLSCTERCRPGEQGPSPLQPAYSLFQGAVCAFPEGLGSYGYRLVISTWKAVASYHKPSPVVKPNITPKMRCPFAVTLSELRGPRRHGDICRQLVAHRALEGEPRFPPA